MFVWIAEFVITSLCLCWIANQVLLYLHRHIICACVGYPTKYYYICIVILFLLVLDSQPSIITSASSYYLCLCWIPNQVLLYLHRHIMCLCWIANQVLLCLHRHIMCLCWIANQVSWTLA